MASSAAQGRVNKSESRPLVGCPFPRPRVTVTVSRPSTRRYHRERSAMSVTETAASATKQANPNDLNSLYKYLRVCDVADALDGIGYFNLTLMAREIRPLWAGMKFWGPAATIRAVPSNKPMWTLDSTQDIVDAHRIWFERYPGRTIIPGRIEVIEVQGTIACGGVQVRPGDMVGCDDDGVVVVPAEVALDVATHARAILLSDMKARREHYAAQGKPLDSTVDVEAVLTYYEGV